MNNYVNPLRWVFALFFDISNHSTTINATQKKNVYYSKSLDPYPDGIGTSSRIAQNRFQLLLFLYGDRDIYLSFR